MTRSISRGLAAAIALAFAASGPVLAQSSTSKGTDPATGGASAQTTTPAPKKPAVVQRAENSRPGQATKRVAKKTGEVAKKGVDATKRAGTKTAGAVRNTGDKIAEKLPKGGTAAGGSAEAGSPSATTGNTGPSTGASGTTATGAAPKR